VKQEVKQEVKHEANGSVKTEIKVQVSDSDDDVPIVGLARRKKLKVETKPVKTEPETPTPRASTATPRKTKKRIKIKYKQQECTEELYKTPKGELTQALLCRWWYALEWPPVKANAPVSCRSALVGRWSALPNSRDCSMRRNSTACRRWTGTPVPTSASGWVCYSDVTKK
jgi:hypothetical protein